MGYYRRQEEGVVFPSMRIILCSASIILSEESLRSKKFKPGFVWCTLLFNCHIHWDFHILYKLYNALFVVFRWVLNGIFFFSFCDDDLCSFLFCYHWLVDFGIRWCVLNGDSEINSFFFFL